MMNYWWVLTWYDYYPDGGLGNVHSTHPSLEAANAVADEIRGRERYGYPSRPDHVKVVDVRDYLMGRMPEYTP